MIVLHSSAVLSLLLREPGHERVAEKLCAAGDVRLSPVSAMDALMALSRRFAEPSPVLGAFLRQSRIRQHAVDASQAYWARHAFLTYTQLRLSLGDCFAYGAAKAMDAPLLYTSGDFGRTDVRAA